MQNKSGGFDQNLANLPIIISGKVVDGQKNGRKIGFPTANIFVKDLKKLRIGIYAGFVCLNQKIYQGAIYIGKSPTFEGKEIKTEVHILDFDKDIYGQNLQVEILEFVRGDQKFISVEQLKSQIFEDCQKIRQILKKKNSTALQD